MYRPIRWPPVPVTPSPKPPKPPVNPEPGTGGSVPPGTGLPPDPITVTPPQPQPPKDPPSGIAPEWSDGCVLVRHKAGSYWVDVWLSGRLVRANILSFESLNQDWINRDIHGVLRFAPPAAAEPWPARNTTQKSSKEALLAQLTSEEKLDVLANTLEAVAKDVSSIKAVLVAHQEELDNDDIWAAALALEDEPPGLDKPLETFDAPLLALYLVWCRSPLNGSKVSPDIRRVDLAAALALGTDLGQRGEVYAELAAKWEVDRDVAIAALLAGLVDPYDTSFDARLERDVAQLAGTVKPETLSTGEVVQRFVRLDLEGLYRRLMPSGSGGQAGQGGA